MTPQDFFQLFSPNSNRRRRSACEVLSYLVVIIGTLMVLCSVGTYLVLCWMGV